MKMKEKEREREKRGNRKESNTAIVDRLKACNP